MLFSSATYDHQQVVNNNYSPLQVYMWINNYIQQDEH